MKDREAWHAAVRGVTENQIQLNNWTTATTMVIAALFTTAKTWKQPNCPSTEEWIKMWSVHTMEYYSVIKKDEIMPFAATWMDLEIITLSKSDKDKYSIYLSYSIIYSWNLKVMIQVTWYMIQIIFKAETDSQALWKKKLVVTKGEREGRDKLGVPD